MTSQHIQPQEIVYIYETRSGLHGLKYDTVSRSSGEYIIIYIGNPSERFFEILNNINKELPDDHPYKDRITLKKGTFKPWISSPEAGLLIKVLSESLTVNKNSFKDDFFDRYVLTLSKGEDMVITRNNHIVYGRRGSGKSSLLLYGMRKLEEMNTPAVWVSMQAYDKGADNFVALNIIVDMLEQLRSFSPAPVGLDELIKKINLLSDKDKISDSEIRKLAPNLKRALLPITERYGSIFIFLDDFHVLNKEYQPILLSYLYSFCRGNNIYLKISAIEISAKIWDAGTKTGLEPTNDIQQIKLDYNLTAPNDAKDHISKILESHAQHCGLPSITCLCNNDALSRLVWVSAGVPRDALYIFIEAMKKSIARKHKNISLTNINLSSAEALDDKMRFISTDSSDNYTSALQILDKIKYFCLKEKRKNAFLAEIINNNSTYESIITLIDLRLLHVINRGITPREAGRTFMALILDYGFYVSIRAGKSMKLLQSNLNAPLSYSTLRELPKFIY